MKTLSETIKKIFFWSYGRTTWQYDLLCLLILAFVFLTPKSWFERGEPGLQRKHRTDTARIIVLTDGTEPDARQLERRLRLVTGRPDLAVVAVAPARDSQGKTVAYEVDIR